MKKGLAILGAVALLSACGEAHGPEAAKANAVTAQGVAVQIEEISLHIPVEGTVVAQNRAEITTRMMARVTVLAVDVGSKVRKGDLLIRLGTDDIAANRSKAEAGVMMAQAAWDEGARHADRMDTLLIQDVVPQVQRDQAHLMLTQAEAQLALAQATLKEVETAESYASIRAPFDGEVVSRTIDVGDVAAPGMPLLAVEETGVREARLFVPVEASRKLNQGDPLRVSALGGLTTEAPVRTVASGADPISKTVEVRVTLPEDWPTGVSVTALVPAGVSRAITIPSEAVVRRGQLTGVRVVTPHGVALRWIRLGRSVAGGDRVEVLTGLTAGDEIVL
jgi:RND family efflux transporter MFP subunit